MIGASLEQQSLDRPILFPGQLIVEGRGPEMVFREMVSHLGIQLDVRTFGEANKRNLQAWLELFSQKAAFKEQVVRIGIVRDAEATNAVRAFQSVQSSLSAAKLAVPNKMNAVEGSPLGVGVFILPNCGRHVGIALLVGHRGGRSCHATAIHSVCR